MISKLNPDTKEFLDCVKTFIVFNSSESAHICKDKRYFCGDILPINLTSGIKKIGGTDFKPSSIGTVKWYWQDDDGRNHEFILEKVLYFTNSPVHILSIEALSDGFDKNEGAWIHTKEKASVFKWNQEIFVQHFGNSTAHLPELEPTSSFDNFADVFPFSLTSFIPKTN